MPFFIDTHTHIYLEEFKNDIDDVVKEAVAKGVEYMLLPNVDNGTLESMLLLHQKYPQHCLPMAGLHPTSAKIGFEKELEKIEPLLKQPEIIGIGETGIDLYWDKSHYKEQEASFQTHIRWALEYDLPIVIHARESLAEIQNILEPFCGKGLRGIMHCFPGTPEDARWFTDFGLLLGIGGVITYKKNGMAAVVEQTGLDHLVLETDAPYLPPVPHRGKRNQPAYIPLIAQKIAEIKNISTEEVARATTQNALNLFRINQNIHHG